MKNKKILIITLICLIGMGIHVLLLSGRRPFTDLKAADITSAAVRLSPPDTTIPIIEIEELVSYLRKVVVYREDHSYPEYAGQGAVFTLNLSDGSQLEITAFDPFVIINGVGYQCKSAPCEALAHYANRLISGEP